MAALYAWLRRHPRLVDGVLAAMLACAGTGPAMARSQYLLVPLASALALPVVFRRAHPTGAFACGIAIGALQFATDVHPPITDLTIVILLYTLAAYRPRRTSVAGLALCLAGSAAAAARWAPARLTLLDSIAVGSIMFAGPSLIAWVLGDSMRYRRAYYASLEDRATRLEHERDAQAQIAAAAERARIARELHDVIAHNVSVMVVQADGASYALDADPDRARQALAAISGTGRQALAEMRGLLGVLRDGQEGTSPGRTPLPGIGELGDLLEQTRATGLAVSFAVEGVPRQLPSGAELAVYRIVQESLTNTRQHGGPLASARVTLRYTEDTLVVRVTDDGVGGAAVSDGAGHGLAGMRERMAVYGGSVATGPLPDRGFQVVARLPLAGRHASPHGSAAVGDAVPPPGNAGAPGTPGTPGLAAGLVTSGAGTAPRAGVRAGTPGAGAR